MRLEDILRTHRRELDALTARVGALEGIPAPPPTAPDVSLAAVTPVIIYPNDPTNFIPDGHEISELLASLSDCEAWLRRYGLTFRTRDVVTIASPQPVEHFKAALYEAAHAEMVAHYVRRDIPAYCWVVGAVADPNTVGGGSRGDAEPWAVYETGAAPTVAHELAHIWTGTGNEAHDVPMPPDGDGNPFNDLPSILGYQWANFPNVAFTPEHEAAARLSPYLTPVV